MYLLVNNFTKVHTAIHNISNIIFPPPAILRNTKRIAHHLLSTYQVAEQSAKPTPLLNQTWVFCWSWFPRYLSGNDYNQMSHLNVRLCTWILLYLNGVLYVTLRQSICTAHFSQREAKNKMRTPLESPPFSAVRLVFASLSFSQAECCL